MGLIRKTLFVGSAGIVRAHSRKQRVATKTLRSNRQLVRAMRGPAVYDAPPPVFHVPPGWPKPPRGWTPPLGWQPDPSWPSAPVGWQFWR